ncbi:MAG: hypothetical protein ACXACR_07720, partial [Candidatus Hodarchaeales archaeon]
MKAVFLAGVITLGPGIISIFPSDTLSESSKIELALKILPTGGKEGDFVDLIFEDYEVVVIVFPVPAFEKHHNNRASYAAFGFILSKTAKTLIYQTILQKIIDACSQHNILTVPTLRKIVPKLYSF